MKTIVLAYHNIGCTGIRALLDHGFDIQAVFTHEDDPGENLWFGSVAETAAAARLPVFAPPDINHPLWVARIREMEPDFLFSFYFRQMVAPEILAIPKQGCLNLHGSLLPRYRGRCPVNWVLIHGEKETGVTLHYMTPRVDDGDIVDQEAVAIDPRETALTLHRKLDAAAHTLLARTLPPLRAGTAGRRPQDDSLATCFGGRRPEDGEIDWHCEASVIDNLVRAVTQPYPGAFSYLGNRKVIFWATVVRDDIDTAGEGEVVSTSPLVIGCGRGAIEVQRGQEQGGLCVHGEQLARELRLARGMRFGRKQSLVVEEHRTKRVLILGADGFIGNHLSERLLDSGRYEVHAMDLTRTSIGRLLDRPGFHFSEGDIGINREWIEYHVRRCDIVLPLVAIATPVEYVRRPLRVFELDFEENLRIVRHCVRYGKRIIFPSTSEVYGMCGEDSFDEDRSRLVLGPIRKQRWIYSCSKQLLDRVIWAYGQAENLAFTLIRPFNWIGPRLDDLGSARLGSSRVITRFILNLVEGTPIDLVDGGAQKRCFTDIRDGIDCLFRIIENKDNRANGRIFNIGNPDNEISIKGLAHLLIRLFEVHPLRSHFPPLAGIRVVDSLSFYGDGYEDIQYRRPSIRRAEQVLGWRPMVGLEESVARTLDFFLRQALEAKGYQP